MADNAATRAMEWIDSELQDAPLTPAPPTGSLCEYLRDGRALCQLAVRLDPSVESKWKQVQRSLHQLSTFHSLERVQCFLKWCRLDAHLEEHLIFTTVQLLDEANTDAVLACIEALQKKFRPDAMKAVKKMADIDGPSPVQESGDENAPLSANGAESTSPTSSQPSSSSKLSAFLSKFPSPASSTTAPVDAPEMQPREKNGKKERPASSRLQIPSAFTASQSGMETAFDGKAKTPGRLGSVAPKGVNLPAYARRRSLSCADGNAAPAENECESEARASKSRKNEPRSVSRLQIPSAFSSGADSRAMDKPKPTEVEVDAGSRAPVEEENRTPARLQIPAAFASAKAETNDSEQPITEEINTCSDAGSPPTISRSTSQPSKRPSKLAQFLSTVEPPATSSEPNTSSHGEVDHSPSEEQSNAVPDQVDAQISANAQENAPSKNSPHHHSEHGFFVMEDIPSHKTPTSSSAPKSKLNAFLSAVEHSEAVIDDGGKQESCPSKPTGVERAEEVKGAAHVVAAAEFDRTKDNAISELAAENKALKEECATLQGSLQTARKHSSSLEAQLDQLRAELVEAKQKAAKIKEELAVSHKEAMDITTRRIKDEANAALESEIRQAKENFDIERKKLKEDIQSVKAAHELTLTEIEGLREEIRVQQDLAQAAKDNEQAARFAAQMAFSARDEAEEACRLQQQKIDELSAKLHG